MTSILRGIHVKVTIDATDSLSDTIRVINALFDVTLAEVDSDKGTTVPARRAAPRPKPAPSASKRANVKVPNGTARRNRSTSPPTPATASEIRAWARGNGHVVSDRGAIPAAIRAAFEAAR